MSAESAISTAPPPSADRRSLRDPEVGLSVSVIIVSYKTREMTLRCLRTLVPELDGIAAEIWLVDNASRDGTIEAVAAEMPAVKVIAIDRNAGFGGANNLALAQAAGEFFLLLNTDAFVLPGAVRAMAEFLKAHPAVGVVGPRLLNENGSLQRSCFMFPSPGHCWAENLGLSRLFGHCQSWPHDREREVEWVVGACLMVRRAAYESAGGFDEQFFMYAEESDWQRRIRGAGWKICFTPAAEVTHFGRGSSIAAGSFAERHFFESLDRYQLKHHGMLGFLMVRIAMMVGCTARAAGWAALGTAVPGQRGKAWAKARFHLWLLKRQATTFPPARHNESAISRRGSSS